MQQSHSGGGPAKRGRENGKQMGQEGKKEKENGRRRQGEGEKGREGERRGYLEFKGQFDSR